MPGKMGLCWWGLARRGKGLPRKRLSGKLPFGLQVRMEEEKKKLLAVGAINITSDVRVLHP